MQWKAEERASEIQRLALAAATAPAVQRLALAAATEPAAEADAVGGFAEAGSGMQTASGTPATEADFASRFTEADFNSGNGMQTAIWGPIFWAAIHTVSFNYPVAPNLEQRQAASEWLRAIGKVLPCRKCRDNFNETYRLASHGATDYDSRDSFSRLCYRLHEQINLRLGKMEQQPSYEQVRDMYEGFRARCHSPEPSHAGCQRALHDGTLGRCTIRIVPRHQTGAMPIEVDAQCRVRPLPGAP